MISCKEYAQMVKSRVCTTIVKEHVIPTLAIVSVGDDPASAAYVRGKMRDCDEVGIAVTHLSLPTDTTQTELNKAIRRRNEDGVILQLPLPKHLNADEALGYLDPRKDVDGLTEYPKYTPCTARGIHEWLKANTELEGKHVVIINRSKLVGKPLAKLMTDSNATVTLCHSKTRDLTKHLAMADIVVVGVGIPNFLDTAYCSHDAIIVDVGINRVDGHLQGDVISDDAPFGNTFAQQVVTPVPGGVGLLTRAFLMDNVLQACLDRRERH